MHSFQNKASATMKPISDTFIIDDSTSNRYTQFLKHRVKLKIY